MLCSASVKHTRREPPHRGKAEPHHPGAIFGNQWKKFLIQNNADRGDHKYFLKQPALILNYRQRSGAFILCRTTNQMHHKRVQQWMVLQPPTKKCWAQKHESSATDQRTMLYTTITTTWTHGAGMEHKRSHKPRKSLSKGSKYPHNFWNKALKNMLCTQDKVLSRQKLTPRLIKQTSCASVLPCQPEMICYFCCRCRW
jgi:hypothetical protein